MANREFLSKHGVVRNAIREDMLFFAIPALLVFLTGLLFSAMGRYNGLWAALWDLLWHPGNLYMLSAQSIIGLALFVIGFTIILIAHFTIGRNYSSTLIIREDHQLITHGIYRFTRHPIYLGVIIVCIGIPLYASSLYGLLTMLVLIPVFLIRIRIEERVLTEEFPDAYRTYSTAVSKLIPFIY